MPIDDRTEHLSLALPHRENALEDDVTRLRAALIRLDGFAGETKARLDDGAALLELAAALDRESGQRKAEDRVLESAAQEALDGLAGLEGRMLESLEGVESGAEAKLTALDSSLRGELAGCFKTSRISFGTEELEDGISELASGSIYLVYE